MTGFTADHCKMTAVGPEAALCVKGKRRGREGSRDHSLSWGANREKYSSLPC